MVAAGKISFYILGSILVIALIILVVTIFKLPSGVDRSGKAASTPIRSFGAAIFGVAPPPSICGLGTSFDAKTNFCKPDEGKLISALIDLKNIAISYDNSIHYDPLLQFTKIVPTPGWYAKWTDIGGPLVCKTSFVASDPYAGKLYTDMKYAGIYENKTCCFKYPEYDATNTCFVNNNITSAGQAANVRNTQQYTAENIHYIFSSDIGQCKQGYCYVNGICVSPYEVTWPIDSVCCPPCIYTPTSEGGCAGKFACDSSKPCENERKVEYPGTQITSFDGRCENKLATSPQCTAQSKSTDECWSVDNKDDSKKQPYKYMEDGFEDICKEVTLCESFNGKNEFDCALSCLTDNLSQKDCSKRCLPKLWRWYPVFAKVGGQKTFRGFMQSDELMQDIQEPIPPLLYCPPDTCVYARDFGKNPALLGCTGCTGCASVIYEGNRGVENRYGCNKCKQCELDIIPVDSGDCGNQTKTLVCCERDKNGDCIDSYKKCTSCKREKVDTNPLFNVYEDKCDQCPTEDINKSCKFYTRVPYINNTVGTKAPTSTPTTTAAPDKKITLRPEVKVYNCGGTQPLVINLAPTTAAPTLAPTTAAPTRAPPSVA